MIGSLPPWAGSDLSGEVHCGDQGELPDRMSRCAPPGPGSRFPTLIHFFCVWWVPKEQRFTLRCTRSIAEAVVDCPS